MPMRFFKPALALSAVLTFGALTLGVLAAPATAQSVRIVNLGGYTVIDDQHVVFRGSASRHYLATLQRRCPGVRFGASIGTSLPNHGTITMPRSEYVISRGVRCYFDTLEEVESVAAAEALIAERAGETPEDSESEPETASDEPQD